MQAEVLDLLRQRSKPLSAYDILGLLRDTNPKLSAPTVYRALAALAERGCAHRLESLNAYIACQCEAHPHASVLSICDGCGLVEENPAPDLHSMLTNIAGKTGFAARRHVIEVHGACASCHATEANN